MQEGKIHKTAYSSPTGCELLQIKRDQIPHCKAFVVFVLSIYFGNEFTELWDRVWKHQCPERSTAPLSGPPLTAFILTCHTLSHLFIYMASHCLWITLPQTGALEHCPWWHHPEGGWESTSVLATAGHTSHIAGASYGHPWLGFLKEGSMYRCIFPPAKTPGKAANWTDKWGGTQLGHRICAAMACML